ncbi:MAG: archease [Candidatus Eisenbacteria bacterium]|uniref:Archease n=1 Tax=Eiseniibacteriota bacterium TaxID=2212470 RepID=A0A538TXW7_UNCEI|nr:MAG: archease [Candidatus Eisenbacteria bacterium]
MPPGAPRATSPWIRSPGRRASGLSSTPGTWGSRCGRRAPSDSSPWRPRLSRPRSPRQGHCPDLLVHWLNTALLEGELRRAVWTRADVSLLTTARIEGTLSGQRLDPRRQTFLREIKAVSMHGLALELEASRCRCRLILDV